MRRFLSEVLHFSPQTDSDRLSCAPQSWLHLSRKNWICSEPDVFVFLRDGRRATACFSFFGKCCRYKKNDLAAASRVYSMKIVVVVYHNIYNYDNACAVGHSNPKAMVFSISTAFLCNILVGQLAKHASRNSIEMGLENIQVLMKLSIYRALLPHLFRLCLPNGVDNRHQHVLRAYIRDYIVRCSNGILTDNL